jgi:hypothetical protein
MRHGAAIGLRHRRELIQKSIYHVALMMIDELPEPSKALPYSTDFLSTA